MDSAEVAAIVAAGETFEVEFKGERRKPLDDHDLVEAVVCMANGTGGVLLIGVEDDRTITGARPRHGQTTVPARLQALIANQTVPPVTVEVSAVELDGLPVIAVQIENFMSVVGTQSGKYVRRALKSDGTPQCVPYPAHEMLAREIDRGAMDYAGLPARGATWEDLDPSEFERYRARAAIAGGAGDAQLAVLSDRDIARALGVVRYEADAPLPSIGAILLFGKPGSLRRFVPTHEAAFQVLRGTQVEVNDFIEGPLLRVAEELLARFQVRNTQDELQMGLLRVPVPLVPEVAVREAIANAFVHRDYTRLGPVTLQMSDDALEISSPGGFPQGVRLDNLLETSQPRSRILADAFKRAGIVERTGRGINRMFEATLRIGRDAPDFSRSTEERVKAVFTTSMADLALARYVLEREQAAGVPWRLEDLQVLHELRRDSDLSVAEAADLLQKSQAETRNALTRMVESGMVAARGSGRARRYHLTAAVYRALDASSAYVRVRTFDALQQEQMVLAFVDAHGSITRADTAGLCQLTAPQASALLRRLSDRGELEMRGERRGARYVRPGGPS